MVNECKNQCFTVLCNIIRDDEKLSIQIETGTVKIEDYDDMNENLYYYFKKFDIFYEHFIPITLDEDPKEVYKVNFEFLTDFLKVNILGDE